jgi:hypothetical protein
MKPAWDQAPAWAHFLAMDENGRWTWFESEPYRGNKCWIPRGPMLYADIQPDWEHTLEERPR